MANIRNDSVKVAEAHRQADLIVQRCAERKSSIADALLDIWQEDYSVPDHNTEAVEV